MGASASGGMKLSQAGYNKTLKKLSKKYKNKFILDFQPSHILQKEKNTFLLYCHLTYYCLEFSIKNLKVKKSYRLSHGLSKEALFFSGKILLDFDSSNIFFFDSRFKRFLVLNLGIENIEEENNIQSIRVVNYCCILYKRELLLIYPNSKKIIKRINLGIDKEYKTSFAGVDNIDVYIKLIDPEAERRMKVAVVNLLTKKVRFSLFKSEKQLELNEHFPGLQKENIVLGAYEPLLVKARKESTRKLMFAFVGREEIFEHPKQIMVSERFDEELFFAPVEKVEMSPCGRYLVIVDAKFVYILLVDYSKKNFEIVRRKKREGKVVLGWVGKTRLIISFREEEKFRRSLYCLKFKK